MMMEVYGYDYTTPEQARRVFERAHEVASEPGESSFWLIQVVSEAANPWCVVAVDEAGLRDQIDWEDGVPRVFEEGERLAFIERRRKAKEGELGAFRDGTLRNTVVPGTPVSLGADGSWTEETDDFGEFVETVKRGIRAEFEAFDETVPDFPAKMILLSPKGVLYALLTHLLRDSESKDYLGEVVMPGLIRAHEASRAAWLSSSVMAMIGEDHVSEEEYQAWRRDHGGSIEGAPWATEQVQAWVADFTGTFTQLSAPIIREEGKPIQLGEWSEGLDGSQRQQWNDIEISSEWWPRLQGDAMLALMGAPTSLEVRAAIKVLSTDPVYHAQIDKALEQLGLDPDLPVEELSKHGAAVLDVMRQDDEFEEWFRARVKEILGDPSPIRKG